MLSHFDNCINNRPETVRLGYFNFKTELCIHDHCDISKFDAHLAAQRTKVKVVAQLT